MKTMGGSSECAVMVIALVRAAGTQVLAIDPFGASREAEPPPTWAMLVRDTGIEPVTSSVSGKRSPAELIAPGRTLEVETGIEPVCTALQAVASPLGHSTAGG